MMKGVWLSCFLTLSLIWSTCSQFYPSIIKTSLGLIQGTSTYFHNSKVDQYLGIPFAQPPVGRLRFQKPEPVKPWDGILIANKPGSACVQYVDYPYPWNDMYGPKSEDCLYLNIWVPQSMQTNIKKPVLFWIHGGGYTTGSNQMPVYNGLALASEGDIIVVTVNYRLSALGFLTTPSKSAPGNAGIYDIFEALKWVNKNIDAFGGDPQQVTLAGESVGAFTTGIFCASPLTKGLFSKVILESGSPAFLEMENNTASLYKSQRLAKALGCADDVFTIFNYPDEVVNCLRGKSAYEIIATENSFHPTKSSTYYPIYGDELIPILPRLSIIAGNFHDVDVLIGCNHDEGSFLEAVSKLEIFGVYGLNSPKINKTFGKSLLDEYFKDFPSKDAVKDYFLRNLAEYNYDEIRDRVYTAMGDFILQCPTNYFAESYARKRNNVYYYFFTHRPSTTPWADWMKVPHFSEVQFVFGQPLLNPGRYTWEEVILSSNIIRMWSNFVKYGSPVPPDQIRALGINWPLYSRTNPQYLELSTRGLTYGIGPHQENCNFFRPYFGFDIIIVHDSQDCPS